MLKSFIRLAAAGLFLAASTLSAGERGASPDPDVSLAHFPTKLLNDLPNLFIPENGVALAAGGFLTAADWALFDQHDSFAAAFQWNTQPLFDLGNFYGEGWIQGGAALGSWGLGALTGDQRLQEFGRDASESLIEATVVVTGLKVAVGRERPDGSDHYSFPSGHSIVAFCFAPVVGKYWGWEAGAGAYLLATVTALARVEGYHHYLSDTIAGATLGIILGNAAVYAPKDVSVSMGPGELNLRLSFN